MRRHLPALILGLVAIAPAARASDVRDPAGMFSPAAVAKADSALDALERKTGVPVVLETVDSLRSAVTPAERQQWGSRPKGQVVNLLAKRKATEQKIDGLYILFAKQNQVMSDLMEPRSLAGRMPAGGNVAIGRAFRGGFSSGDFDEGLAKGVTEIERVVGGLSPATATTARSTSVRGARPGVSAPRPTPAPATRGGSWISSLILFGLIALAVVLGVRLLGGLLRAMTGGGASSGPPAGGYGPGPYPQQQGPMGGGMNYGQRAGGWGGGGGGGGFWSGMLGGLGGAVAGNWMYDQFRDRHPSAGSTSQPTGGGLFDPGPSGGDEIVSGGGGGDWGGGGGDAGGARAGGGGRGGRRGYS